MVIIMEVFTALVIASLVSIGISVVVTAKIFYSRDKKNVSESSANVVRFEKRKTSPLDLMQSSFWCRKALQKFGNDCCPIFEYIRTQQGDEPWGTVLDAGTGQHSLDWLLGLDTLSCTAVTGDLKRKQQLEDSFTLREKDRILVGNWKNESFLKGQVFDVVLADYLVGSLDAFAPYFQYRFFERLRPNVGKYLYITGAEPLPDNVPPSNKHGQLMVEIWKLRDACILLSGERPYREYPLHAKKKEDWVLRALQKAGFQIKGVAFFSTTCREEYVENQIAVAESKLWKVKDDRVASAMQQYCKTLRSRVRSLSWGIEFGSDYVVQACPMRESVANKSPTTLSPTGEFVKGYTSPILQQESVFPLDE